MKTMNQNIKVMLEVKELVNEWLEYTKNLGNECAYTDSILELIQKKVSEL